MFGRQAPVHDHNLGRLHEALLGKGIKKKGPRVERGRIGKGSVVLYDPMCFIHISMVVKYQICSAFRHENCILLGSQLVSVDGSMR